MRQMLFLILVTGRLIQRFANIRNDMRLAHMQKLTSIDDALLLLFTSTLSNIHRGNDNDNNNATNWQMAEGRMCIWKS